MRTSIVTVTILNKHTIKFGMIISLYTSDTASLWAAIQGPWTIMYMSFHWAHVAVTRLAKRAFVKTGVLNMAEMRDYYEF